VNGKRTRFFYGWLVVATAALGLFFGVPVAVYSFSVSLRPLMQQFHAGRAAVSLAYTLGAIAGAISVPLVGWLVDRCGARRVILIATGIFGMMLLSNKFFSDSIYHFYIFYALLGIALQGVGPVPYGDVVCHWFDRRRGLALGLMMLGIGLGAMIMPSLAQQLIAAFGWSKAYGILGGAVLVIAIPSVAVFLKERPEDLGLTADGAPKKTITANEYSTQGVSAREAWRTKTFWLMVCAIVLVSASVQGCVLHLASMFSDRGMNPQTAALAASLAGAAVLLGRVGTGYLLDQIFAPYLAAAFFASSSLGIAMLWLGSPSIAFVGAFLVGLGLGAEVDLIAYLTSRYFGLRAFGTIYSLIFASFVLAGALGPLIMGAGFDQTGSYARTLVGFLAATLVAAALIIRVGPYRYHAPQRNAVEPMLPANIAENLPG
jgi:MFS family permease